MIKKAFLSTIMISINVWLIVGLIMNTMPATTGATVPSSSAAAVNNDEYDQNGVPNKHDVMQKHGVNVDQTHRRQQDSNVFLRRPGALPSGRSVPATTTNLVSGFGRSPGGSGQPQQPPQQEETGTGSGGSGAVGGTTTTEQPPPPPPVQPVLGGVEEDLGIRFNKVDFFADESPPQGRNPMPFQPEDYPLDRSNVDWLRETKAVSVVSVLDCHECTRSPAELVRKIGGLPSHPVADPTAEYWEELLEVVNVQIARRAGDDPRNWMPLPAIWEGYNIDDVAKAVHDEVRVQDCSVNSLWRGDGLLVIFSRILNRVFDPVVYVR